MSRRAVVSHITHTRPYTCPRCIRRQKLTTPSIRRAFQHTTRLRKESNSTFLSTLEERGYINQIAGDRNILEKVLETKDAGIYAGIDPTAPSLHLGHLLPLMVLFWALVHGHNVISLIGGGTARVGDPSGRLLSREKTDAEVQHANFESMFAQTAEFWEKAVRYAQRYGYDTTDMGRRQLLDNGRWLDQLDILEFLKTLGNGMRVGAMLGRDTVRNKMDHGDGMSFSEFTYPLLQGWDWWHMYRYHDVRLQVGGSDQYGNIVAGMDAVKYIAQNSPVNNDMERSRWLNSEGRLNEDYAPMGLTVPLLTTSSGEKFGKSAGNAVWLDAKMTSPFDLYGFLLRTSDADVKRYLKLFTFRPVSGISELMTQHGNDPGKRLAQHTLAWEVLCLVHELEVANKTQAEHKMMRNPNLLLRNTKSASDGIASSSQSEVGENREAKESSIMLPKSQIIHQLYTHILHSAGLAESRSHAARMLNSGSVYVAARTDGQISFTQIKNKMEKATQQTLVDGTLLLRVGKWKVRVIEVKEDDSFEEGGEEG